MHRIRLGSAWRVLESSGGDSRPEPKSHNLPLRLAHLAPNSAHDRVSLLRSFHRPTGLSAEQTIRLELVELIGGAVLHLNGIQLACPPAHRDNGHTMTLDIGDILRDHNTLQIDFDFLGADADPAQTVLAQASLVISE